MVSAGAGGFNMKTYIGTKMVNAEPIQAGQPVLAKDNKTILSQHNEDGYRVVYEDGYVSWSPKEVFEKAYREITVNHEDRIEEEIMNFFWAADGRINKGDIRVILMQGILIGEQIAANPLRSGDKSGLL
jgi:hypothetical protein